MQGTCPALTNAGALTQTELLIELTNECRYDKMVRPPGEKNDTEPILVAARAYVYTIQSNTAKTLVISHSSFLFLHIYVLFSNLFIQINFRALLEIRMRDYIEIDYCACAIDRGKIFEYMKLNRI